MRGIATMSAWIKERIFGAGSRDSDVQRAEPVRVARRGTATSERPAAEKPKILLKACKHGTPKGWRCWQCGGISIVE